MTALVFGLSVSYVVVLWAIGFGMATTCTDDAGRNCDLVDATLYVSIGAGLLVGVIALFGPWPKRHPVGTYVAAMFTVGLLAFALMASLSA